MADLHDYHLCLAHGWGRGEAEDFYSPGFHKIPRKTAIPKFTPAKDFASEPVIPDPALFGPLARSPSASSVTSLPEVSQCAAHLELLEAIYHLRMEATGPTTKRVWRKEVVRQKYKHVPYDIPDPTYPERSKKKWDVFLTLAVLRFELWAERSEAVMRQSGATETILPHLPPLDVLAVWHALLLNPGDYVRYCKRHELQLLPLAPFPWERIHKSIRSKSIKVGFEISPAEANWFEEVTKQPVSLFNELEGADGKPPEVLSEALLAYGGEYSDGLRNVGPFLFQMSETDRGYALVRLMANTKKTASDVQPLMDNVIRQGSFVDKMHAQLWLRSPAVGGTLRRAVDRYDKLTQLFRDYPGQTLVPTLDMDLVWHTHQLSHAGYRTGIKAITGRFIDHDDKIGKGTLSVQEGGTRRLFEDVFDEEYSRCMCWDCEAIFSAVETDDQRSVEAGDCPEVLAADVRGDVQYYRAAEVARGKGGAKMQERVTPLPIRKGALS